jgi:hypothetical protein
MAKPKCANPSCKTPNEAVSLTVTMILEDGDDLSGTSAQARVLMCQTCGVAHYGPIVGMATNQARARAGLPPLEAIQGGKK